MTHRQTSLLVVGLCCILLPSLGMLATTYYNRAGRPASTLALTERELRLPLNDSDSVENSALTFRLIWRVAGMGHSDIVTQQASATPVRWLTAQKAAALGVNSNEDLRWRSSVPAFLVLEFNGPSYAHELDLACAGAQSVACDRTRGLESRLYVVDAGPDADVLHREYPDTATYAIVRGIVSFTGSPAGTELTATIGGLDVETIQAIEPLRSGRAKPSGEMNWHLLGKDKSFIAQIAFGHRREPWNQAVSFGPHPSPPAADASAYRDSGRIEVNPH